MADLALFASDSRSKMVVVRGRCATLRAVRGLLNGVGGRLRSESLSSPSAVAAVPSI